MTFSSLSPHDFEILVQDLWRAEHGQKVESFAPGRDQGIDLRLFESDGGKTIIQCKHYEKSGYSALKSSLKKEMASVDKLKPARYIIVTSVSMTPPRKDELKSAMHPWVRSVQDIVGQEDVSALLRDNPEVEKAHFKLWIHSTGLLERVLHNQILVRTEGYVADLKRIMQVYVTNDSLSAAQDVLTDQHVVIISGAPGVGKTTLASVLLAEHVANDFTPVVVSSDVDEADRLFSLQDKQVFLYDDFLGRTSSFEQLTKNEDDRLVRLMARVGAAKNKRLIMTTRDYLLVQAQNAFERLNSGEIEVSRMVLDVGAYTRLNKAEILYNHLYFSDLSRPHLRSVVKSQIYKQLIEHANYLPRLIEDAVKLATKDLVEANKFPAFLLSSFDNPGQLWSHILEVQFGISEQTVLLLLLTLDPPASFSELEAAYVQAAIEMDLGSFERAFHAVEGTAARLVGEGHTPSVDFVNPGLQDAVISKLLAVPKASRAAMEGLTYFEQCVSMWAHASEVERAHPLALTLAGGSLSSASLLDLEQVEARKFQNPGSRAVLSALSKPLVSAMLHTLERRILSFAMPVERRTMLTIAIARDVGRELSFEELNRLEALAVLRVASPTWYFKSEFIELLKYLVAIDDPRHAPMTLSLVESAVQRVLKNQASLVDFEFAGDLRTVAESRDDLKNAANALGLPTRHELIDLVDPLVDHEFDALDDESDVEMFRSTVEGISAVMSSLDYWDSRLSDAESHLEKLEEGDDADDHEYDAWRDGAGSQGQDSEAKAPDPVDPVDELFDSLER